MVPPPDRETQQLRRQLATGELRPPHFRRALTRVPEPERDSWVDRVFGIEELPDDGPALPRGCVPYLPSSVASVLQMVDLANVQSSDVFIDVGSGLGRVTALMHLLTGAGAIGLEIQPALVQAARALAARLNAPRVAVVEGDAVQLTRYMMNGSVFFLYCPFSGERMETVLEDLGEIARTRQIRVCSVDVSLPVRPWLAPVARVGGLSIHRSVY